MKNKFLIIGLFLIVFNVTTQAQLEEKEQYIKAVVATDTLHDGNTFEFRVIIKNLKGDFVPPQLSDFEVVGGPNISSNMQYINGDMSKELSYTYILRAKKIGEVYIEEAYLEMDGQSLETMPIPILVMDNPENIEKNYTIEYNRDNALFSPFEIVPLDKAPKKTKRKIKKI